MDKKKETRGRKALASGKHKAPQATMKINEFIVPFVTLLKSNLKIGTVNQKTIEKLFNVLEGESNEIQTDAIDFNNTSMQCCFKTKKGYRCRNKVSHVDNLFNEIFVNCCEYHYKSVINIEHEKQIKKGNL